MDLSHSSNRDSFAFEPGITSLTSLLEQGLYFVRQGRYAEGVAFFELAREKLPQDQSYLTAVIDSYTQGYVSYWQAQEALNLASKRFVEADAQHQSRTATLETLVSTIIENVKDELQTEVQPGIKARIHHTQHQQPPTSAEDPPPHPSPFSLSEENNALPALYFNCFGHFEVRRSGQLLTLCSNRNGQAILRYLVAQPDHRATMDILMAAFWPDDEPEVAHHKLQVAVSALRRSLNGNFANNPGGGYILCKRQVYQLNPSVSLRTDFDEFLELYHAGRRASSSAASALYEQACRLYTGPFLLEDLYVDWSSLRRGQLNHAYLTMCSTLVEYYAEIGHLDDTVMWATALLKENHCDENAHRQLIRAYVAQGRRNEALRQYHCCQQILFEELGVEPEPETVELFQSLRSSDKSQR